MGMSAQKERLAKLVMDEDLSSVAILSTRLGMGEDEVKAMLQQLTTEGVLKGRLTPDGQRFFREDLRVSSRPAVSSSDEEPAFMRYNSKPGKYAAVVGFIIVVSGYVLLTLGQGDMGAETQGIVLMLLGLFILILGCYYVGRRKTPS